MIHPSDIGALRFAHQAMHTEFEIFCVHPDGDYARQAAWAAFDLLDRLENELSRFIPNSDISRINHLAAGESVRVSRWTLECLDLARQAYEETGGAFDISLGTGFASLELARRESSVRATDSGVRLDLGGIGKGYAVDRMAEVLDEWDIRQALIHGGHSSVLALDAPPGLAGWPLTMGERTVAARRQAFSASGIRSQGAHIVDPRSGLAASARVAATSAPTVRSGLAAGERVAGSSATTVRSGLAASARVAVTSPTMVGSGLAASARVAAWVSLELDGSPSPSAVAEAYSTAFMILPAAEVDAILARHPGLEAWYLEATPVTK